MKVFIRSLIAGAEPFREAARSAVGTLRYEPIMSARAALRLNRTHLVEDLLVPLQRTWKTG